MNGVAEKINSDSMNAVRTLLLSSKLKSRFWAEALQCYARVRNRLPHSTDKNAAPYEEWFGRKPNIFYFRIFGSLCFYHLPKVHRNKLDPIAHKGIFVGYANYTKGYRIFDPEKNSIIEIKHVKFDESVIGINGSKHNLVHGTLSDSEFDETSDFGDNSEIDDFERRADDHMIQSETLPTSDKTASPVQEILKQKPKQASALEGSSSGSPPTEGKSLTSHNESRPLGWIRKESKRRGGQRTDVYYYSPDGIKCRSLNDVKRLIKKQNISVSLDDFYFKPLKSETIVGALVLSLPVIFRVVIVCLFFWLPFAILGINFFAGLFFRCVDSTGNLIESSVVSGKTECLKKNHTWKNNFMNFDHIGNSYMTLFQAALFANWADLAQLMVDHRHKNMQPLENSHPEQFLFVILFLLVGGFFTINLFVGVAVDTFKTMHKRVEGGPAEFALTKPQMLYYRAMRKIGRRKFMILVEPPSNPFCKKCFKIIDSSWFRIASFGLICINTIVIASSSYEMSHTKARTLHILQYTFIPFYMLECLIKICGLGKHYFTDIFNIQDLCTFVVNIIGEIIHNIFGTPANVCAFLFAFRIIRVFDLLQLTDVFVSLRLLMYATIASIPPLLNLCLLLFIIHFIYAIVGIALFGYVKHSGYLNNQSNFEYIQNALLVLFRLTTNEGWEKVYEGLSIEPPECVHRIYVDQIWTSNCGNKVAAAIFLVSFIFCTNIILVNIFIAVILDNYKAAISEEQDIFKERNLILFNQTWRKYDPTGTQFIHVEKLPIFLDELARDLRVSKPNGVAIAYMELPVTTANQVHSLEVLQGILKVKSGRVEDTDVFVALRNQMHLRYERMFPELKGSRFIFTTLELKRRNYAARVLQMNFKKLQQSRLTLMEIERRKIKLSVLSAFPSSHRRPSLAPSRRLSILANQLSSTIPPNQKVSRKRKTAIP